MLVLCNSHGAGWQTSQSSEVVLKRLHGVCHPSRVFGVFSFLLSPVLLVILAYKSSNVCSSYREFVLCFVKGDGNRLSIQKISESAIAARGFDDAKARAIGLLLFKDASAVAASRCLLPLLPLR